MSARIQHAVQQAAPTAAALLTLIKTVDGSGSGLDADTLDGNDSAFFYSTSNPPPAGGQPIPSSSTLAVGTMILLTNSSGGSIADGATVAGSSCTRPIPGISTWSGSGPALTGTWTNRNGGSVANNTGGLFARTA